jgi:hypothetical protein
VDLEQRRPNVDAELHAMTLVSRTLGGARTSDLHAWGTGSTSTPPTGRTLRCPPLGEERRQDGATSRPGAGAAGVVGLWTRFPVPEGRQGGPAEGEGISVRGCPPRRPLGRRHRPAMHRASRTGRPTSSGACGASSSPAEASSDCSTFTPSGGPTTRRSPMRTSTSRPPCAGRGTATLRPTCAT